MITRCAAGIAALFLFLTAPPSVAQDITLISPDGGVEISGNLLGFDGEFYRVDTDYGELTVDGSGVTCEGPGCPSLSDFIAELRFSGAAAMGDVMVPALLHAFAQRNGLRTERSNGPGHDFAIALITQDTNQPVGVFEFGATTTDEGFVDLLRNEADFVLSMREIRPQERQMARDAGMGDLSDSKRSRVVALDAVVPIVAPSNPVREIEPQNLARVFAGEITNWGELGGPDAPIALHLPAAQTGLGQTIEDRLLKPVRLSVSEQVTRHTISLDIAPAVMRDPFAIGIASYAETGTAQVLTFTGSCGYTLAATRLSIKTEDYPLTSPMFLYMPARRLPKIGRDFVAFLRSPTAQLVIRRAGFVDQTPEFISVDAQGLRFANAIDAAGAETLLEELQRMVRTLMPFQRLTTSFRFEAGSARLDAQSRSNVEQFARALELGTYDTRRLIFVGFSDGDGAAKANRDIALRRAEAVRRAVANAAETADLARVQLDIDAFGEALPMACDDSAWGRQANRRVEVWVR